MVLSSTNPDPHSPLTPIVRLLIEEFPAMCTMQTILLSGCCSMPDIRVHPSKEQPTSSPASCVVQVRVYALRWLRLRP